MKIKYTFVTLIGISCLLSGCVSILTAGPLGYETMSLPVAVPPADSGAVAVFTQAQISAPGSAFNTADHSVNGVAGLGVDLSTPPFLGLFLTLPASVSGYAGAAFLRTNLETYYPNGVIEPYWGLTTQWQPALNATDSKTWRVSLGGLYWESYEAGPYANFRAMMQTTDTRFINQSPSYKSGGGGLWLEVAVRPEDKWLGGRVMAGLANTDFFEGDLHSTVQILFRAEGWAEWDHNRFEIGYSALSGLNNSLIFGYTRLF